VRQSWRGFSGFLTGLHPVRMVTLGYLSYIVAGWLLLSLPFSHALSAVSPLDALFTATSAVSTTGLATVSTGNNYNLLGQIIIMVLIQLGGIGYMTFGSFVVLAGTGTLSERRKDIGTTVFSMPPAFKIDKFIRSVVKFTALVEGLGAAALFVAFMRAGLPNPLWSSIFHSVSAFCTAGFSLYDSNFEQLRGDFWINVILAVESYLGAMGFIVMVDVWRRIIAKTDRITLTSRIIIVTTAWVSGIALVLFFLGEPTIQQFPAHERLLASFFQVMAAMTTVGFNTIPIGALSRASLFLLTMLMVIGASPSGTGGGLKTTTFTAIFGVMKSVLLGREQVTFWGKTIPQGRVWLAVATLGFYTVALTFGSYLLSLTDPFDFEALFFEAASALGTVGLSTGITAQLSALGKFLVTTLMFLGRVGPLAFGLALSFPSRIHGVTEEDLVI